MRKVLSVVVRAAALASLVAQTTGAADLANALGAAAKPALFPPQAARLARPLPAKPWSWPKRLRADARLLSGWLESLTAEPPPPQLITLDRLERAQTLSVAPAAAECPADRIMLVPEKTFRGAARISDMLESRFNLDYHPPVYQKRFEMPWLQGRGLRARVVYLDVYGATKGEAAGFRVLVGRLPAQFVPTSVPPAYRRDFPIYFHHDLVRAEVEVENTGDAPLADVEVAARQETFNISGQAGDLLTEPVELAPAMTLAPGQKVALSYRFRLDGPGNARVNFEQTHLVVAGAEGVLSDEAQAGIVDPPNLP